MNDTQLLERLSSAYATVEAPPPSAALAALMDAGGVRDDETRDAVVVPFTRPRTRVRMRYLVAATVATFMLFSGLAVAGALPDPLQRQVSQVVSHLGIDLPHPGADDHGSAPPPEHGVGHSTPSSTAPGASAGGDPGAGAATGTPGDAGGASAPGNDDGSTSVTPPPTAPGSVLGGVGDLLGGGSTPTTLPPSDGSGGLLPPLTVPQLTLPPLTVPQLTLPPLTVAPLTLPSLGL